MNVDTEAEQSLSKVSNRNWLQHGRVVKEDSQSQGVYMGNILQYTSSSEIVL